ncbi:flavin-containing monooxygenase 5-like isoform X2 [Gigantopelta aegis]|uniref:flavin-containing monooxygenase 5-like isoform X2 n=1 Tax=Gigantopelta aegis TaxID=1735272 RepID=UPI001B8882BC|nr:flavin-containing monooxygenase 5-like isoform X2 [Gigantopelta aegis]
MSRRRVAVVGAGVSGIAAAKACLDEGLEPACFEVRADLGGIWKYSEECNTEYGARIYQCLITNTSKWMTSFSDFPFPADNPPYFSYDLFYDYLQNYAKHFDLIKHIHFKTKVLSVAKTNDYDVTGRWNVTTECSGNVRTETFDCVMVGCGFYNVPLLPRIDGIDRFQGTKSHSQAYTTHDKYKNKRVLVIGNGSSAGDLAADISYVAKQVYLSVGDGCWIVSRRDVSSKPIDLILRRIYFFLPPSVLRLYLTRRCNHLIDHYAFGLQGGDGHALRSMLMVNDDLPMRLMCGKVKVAESVTSLSENEATFKDGTVIGSLDCVVFATGYEKDLSVISPSICDGWNDIGFHNPEIKSPNIDKLATEGVILNSSYVQPLCSPSRSAIMTGYYPFKMGLQHWVIFPYQPVCVPLNITLLPEKLKELGYSTHMIGKWHLGFCSWKCTPTYRGFDSFFGYYNADEDYYSHTVDNYLDFHENKIPAWNYNGTYSTNLFASVATDIINRHNKSRPLFLYLPFQAVHEPIEVPKRYEDMYPNIQNEGRRKFSGMVSALDEAVGNVTSALKQNGMLDDTLIFFTADNGGWIPYYGNNYPLRGGKLTVYEGGTRAVAFINGRGLKKPGTVYDGMMHAIDWMPTIIAAAGGNSEWVTTRW